jgi:hypothetical protein
MATYRIVMDSEGRYMPQQYHPFVAGYQHEGFKDIRNIGFLSLSEAKEYIAIQKNVGKVVWTSDD